MSWRIIYIEESESMNLYLDNVKVIDHKKNEITIPLSDIHSIIIDNPRLTVTVQLLNKCAEYNVNIVMCDMKHTPCSISTPISGSRNNSLIQRKQILWTDEDKKYMHKIIIQNKIRNQRKLLEYSHGSNEVIYRLRKYEEEVQYGDATNREGLAAKSYFRELFGSEFKRFNEDVMNAGLDYGYSILRSQISKTIIAKGLNPIHGIIHYGPENNFNLSDDIIEVFRPIIDTYCYKKLSDTNIFKKENRIDLIKTTTIYVFLGDDKQTLFNAISMYIDSILHFFETGCIDRIKDVSIPYEKI